MNNFCSTLTARQHCLWGSGDKQEKEDKTQPKNKYPIGAKDLLAPVPA